MAKTKLTDKLCDEICKDIKSGVPIDHAAIAHGITRATFYNWYNKGKEATRKNKFKRFYDAVNEAKSMAIALRARRIYKAGESHWQADAWWLERVDPDNFGKMDKHEVDMKADVNTTATVNLLDKIKKKREELNDLD